MSNNNLQHRKIYSNWCAWWDKLFANRESEKTYQWMKSKLIERYLTTDKW